MTLKKVSDRAGKNTHETWSIETVRDYIRFIDSKIESRKYIYRGQGENDQLIPSISRIVGDEHCVEITERNLFDSFTQQAIPYLSEIPSNDWDWLSIAQHHSLPSRLLDWSLNPLSGLWFVVNKSYSTKFDKLDNGIVWCYKVDENDIISKDQLEQVSPFEIEKIKVFYPRHVSPRIKAQQALFTVHPIQIKDYTHPLEWSRESMRFLTKVLVDKSCFPNIRKQLSDIGIHSATMFPDLDGLSQHLTWHQTIWSYGDNFTGK